MKRLRTAIQELDKDYRGYYYKLSDILTVLICGALCGLQNISDIYEWSKATPVREFFFNEFRIRKFPSRAQFYNIIGCVNSEKFNKISGFALRCEPALLFYSAFFCPSERGLKIASAMYSADCLSASFIMWL